LGLLSSIMKIFCVGRNYAAHAAEMNQPLPEEPVIFMKPPTAVLRERKPFYYPTFSNEIHFETELVVKIGKNGKHIEPAFALDYIEAVTLGLDLTARDIQSELKKKGLPWELAKGFDQSAVIGEWQNFDAEKWNKTVFTLRKNDAVVQTGTTKDMIYSLTDLLVFISSRFTIQKGDLLFTGTPEGVGPIHLGDTLEGFIDGAAVLYCQVK